MLQEHSHLCILCDIRSQLVETVWVCLFFLFPSPPSHYLKWKEVKAEMRLCIALCSCSGPAGSILSLVMNELGA